MNIRRLFARCQHPLHANANSEKGYSALYATDYGIAQSGMIERRCRLKMPHSRQYDLVRLGNLSRICSDSGLGSHMVERLLHRGEIACLVIDNRDHYSNPLVLGSRLFICLSRQQAARRARANALNNASIL